MKLTQLAPYNHALLKTAFCSLKLLEPNLSNNSKYIEIDLLSQTTLIINRLMHPQLVRSITT